MTNRDSTDRPLNKGSSGRTMRILVAGSALIFIVCWLGLRSRQHAVAPQAQETTLTDATAATDQPPAALPQQEIAEASSETDGPELVPVPFASVLKQGENKFWLTDKGSPRCRAERNRLVGSSLTWRALFNCKATARKYEGAGIGRRLNYR
jgi:hypothetical protein